MKQVISSPPAAVGTPRFTRLTPLTLALLLAGLGGCGDQSGSDAVATGSAGRDMDAIQQAEERQAAIYDEADSLWQLEEQHAAQREADAATEPTGVHPVQVAPRYAQRMTGDYSFEEPPNLPVSRAGQLLNLPAPGATARFTVTDRQWPATTGALSIALWPDDKLAAFSLSIDDNHVQDHAFWYEMAEQYGWKWTWFVIANQVGWSSTDHWGHWQRAIDKGHDIQDHTYSHLCDALFYTSREYRQAQVVISQNLDGAKVVTMAYPFGVNTNKAGSPCEPLTTERTANSRSEAAKQFLAVRDVYGALTSPAKIDYLQVPSISAARNFFNPQASWAYFDSVLDPTSKSFRTWYSAHYHNVPNDTAKNEVRAVLAHLKTRENDVWVGTFTAVAQYAQEYASARLVSPKVTANSVQFELKDDMYDAWFDQPLTVKVRLPTGWAGTASATQGGIERAVTIRSYQGNPYALIAAVPDRGVVRLLF